MPPAIVTATPSTWMPTMRSDSASRGGWGRNKIVAVAVGCTVLRVVLVLLADALGLRMRRKREKIETNGPDGSSECGQTANEYCSTNVGTINPYEAEHGPNPVMFPHLRIDPEGMHPPSLQNPSPLQNMTRSNNSTVLLPSSNPLGIDSRRPRAEIPTTSLSEQYTKLDHLLSPDRGYDSEGGPSSALYSSPLDSDGQNVALHACTHCSLRFRTPGQLNIHANRRHRRRYACEHCTSAFALKADLQRHKLTVHRDVFGQIEKVWKCSNFGCSIPNREFRRKDNCARHIARCRKEIDSSKKEEVKET